MPEMDGMTVAKLMKDKPVIFITDVYNKLKEAVDLVYPIDVITKPIKKPRLLKALEKAYKILNYRPEQRQDREYEIFNVAENKGKTRIRVHDILLVQTDRANCRNKKVFMRTGEHLTLMRCSNEKLLSLSSKLVQVNKAELVSTDAVKDFKHNEVTLTGLTEGAAPKKIALNRIFKQTFIDKMYY
jgi:DNA-binding LytR/AlgR family response regulator